uniref:Uncharacterized protein n=1 Tax=Encephalitozoon cuniculi TaxID=6035 RepID=M1K2M5_ENCCN|nr:hypothetical protein ECU08_0620 [Encephalitozoon cuniculi]
MFWNHPKDSNHISTLQTNGGPCLEVPESTSLWMDARIYEIIKKNDDLEEQIKKILGAVKPLDVSEVMAYLMKKTMDVFRADPSVHCYLLGRVPLELITRFAPGLLSFYFCLLRDQKTKGMVRNAALDSVKHVLESVSELDDTSEAKIHEFFRFYGGLGVEEIYIICARRFRTSRKVFFISELLVLGHQLEDDDYSAVNDKIEEVFSPGLVRRLLDRGKYRNNEEVFDKLVRMYGEGEDVADIISRIQERYDVKNAVLELCVVNEETTRQVLQTNDLEKIERFFRNAVDVPLHIDVIGKYLELCESPRQILGCRISKRLDIRKIISEDYDEFLEYAFNRLALHPRILINLVGIEFRPKMEDFILQLIEFVSGCSDVEKLGLYLRFVKIVVEKNCLRRSILKRIFEGLVYLDNEDCRIRCMKYEILGELFGQYALMDKAIEHAARLDGSDKEHGTECKCLGSRDILERVDTRSLDEDNANVLAAIMWDELIMTPAEGELMAISILLRRIIDSTGMFYGNRVSKSSFVLHLIDRHGIARFNETRRRMTDEFFRLLGSMAKLSLSKNLLEKMFLISLDYFYIFDVDDLIRAIIENDRYHCLFILYNLTRSREKMLSKKLLEFLKKSLREAQRP